MAATQITRNIALTRHLDDFVQAKVKSGRYQSVSEVVREGLRLLENRELDRMRSEIEVGWRQSERDEVIDGPSVFAEIRRMSKARRHGTKIKR